LRIAWVWRGDYCCPAIRICIFAFQNIKSVSHSGAIPGRILASLNYPLSCDENTHFGLRPQRAGIGTPKSWCK
jgi:hypothetical protein